LVAGEPLWNAAIETYERLQAHHVSDQVIMAVERALDLAARGEPSPETVESLGEGWVAEEALGISLYCSLVASDFRDGVLLAVNHGGDSDSTGAITGNILGARLGVGAIPDAWLAALELHDVIETVANDLLAHVDGTNMRDRDEGGWGEVDANDWERYPGW
jgi:ADP-ribosylglycohydrolase